MRADTTTQQLEQRLQQIAQRITPCPVPDITGGWDLCAHGLPWTCPPTEAAWIARGHDATEQIHASMAWLRCGRAKAYASPRGGERMQVVRDHWCARDHRARALPD